MMLSYGEGCKPGNFLQCRNKYQDARKPVKKTRQKQRLEQSLLIRSEPIEPYAAPISIPTASTMAPPITIWNTACRNGVSM
jgi:hypothetical protein